MAEQTVRDLRALYYHPGAVGERASELLGILPAAWQETLTFNLTTTPQRILPAVDRAQYASRVRVIYHNRGSGAVFLGPSNLVNFARQNGIALTAGERLIDEWPFVHMGEVWAVSDSTALLAVTVVSAL
jgi:hypothetical protein